MTPTSFIYPYSYSFFGFGRAASCKTTPVINSLNSALFIIASIIGAVAFCESIRVNAVLAKGGKWQLSSANIQCIFFCSISSFFITGWAFGYALTSLQVDDELVFERTLKAPFIGGTSAFGTIAIVTVSLTWMDLAMRASHGYHSYRIGTPTLAPWVARAQIQVNTVYDLV